MKLPWEDRYIPEPNSGCFLWLGRAQRYGYVGRNMLAHRVAWERVNGAIPDGMHVLHRCDVPLCVNPDHLCLGTHADNMRDMSQKGRQKSGYTDQTHCKHGHPLSGENVYHRPDGRGRQCRICTYNRKRRPRRDRHEWQDKETR